MASISPVAQSMLVPEASLSRREAMWVLRRCGWAACGRTRFVSASPARGRPRPDEKSDTYEGFRQLHRLRSEVLEQVHVDSRVPGLYGVRRVHHPTPVLLQVGRLRTKLP